VFAELRNTIDMFDMGADWTYTRGHSGDLYMRHNTTGSEVLFRGLDDIEKIKSIQGITDMWVEEATEIEESDLNQLDIRMRHQTDTYNQIIITFNPVSITSFLKTRFFDNHIPDLQSGEIYTYVATDFSGIIQYATVLHTTYKHNKFLSPIQIATLEGFKDKDPYYYDVYCLGMWGVIGKTVFDSRKVSERLLYLRTHKIGTIGRFTRSFDGTIDFLPDANGMWTIYFPPTKRGRYCNGSDVAEGNEWGDYNAAHIMDIESKHQVCVFHGHVDVDKFADELELAGLYYNKALLNPEVNFNPGLVLNLERKNYPRIYLRQVTDTISKQLKDKFGWRTDKYNRQSMISDLVEFTRDFIDSINCQQTLDEMLTFVRDEKGKPCAQQGKHDDLVMALAICLQTLISGQIGTYTEEQSADLSKLSDDLLEDYYKANEIDRKYLLLKWGLIKTAS
jgi:phage terminase large subunit